MPELPEVETVVRQLRDQVVGRQIQGAHFPAATGRMTNLPQADLAARIAGQTVQSLRRRAKYLLFQLAADTLIVHLKMTGHLYLALPEEENAFDRWLRVRFALDDGRELRFSDSRRFGRVYLADDPVLLLPDLGPEPLEDSFTLADFRARIAGRAAVMKALLLDQSFIAGVGNIYADEALHIAGIHPLRKANGLSDDEVAKLYHAIRQALNDGVAHMGASIGWYRQPGGGQGQAQHHLRAYRARGDARPCPVCGTPITTIRVGGRGTHFCAVCQTR
jgi:formamidopyrimidine-DNA glycosylase